MGLAEDLIEKEFQKVGPFFVSEWSAGSFDTYQISEAELRISDDFKKMELAVLTEDVLESLALARTIHPKVRGIEHILHLYDDNEFTFVKREGDEVIYSAAIEPTRMGIMVGIPRVSQAHDIALLCAINNWDIEDFRKSPLGGFLEYVEKPQEGKRGWTALWDDGIPCCMREETPEDAAERLWVDAQKASLPDSLSDLSTSVRVNFAPAKLKFRGKKYSTDDICISSPFRDKKDIKMFSFGFKERKAPYRFSFTVPEEVRFETYADLESLTKVVIDYGGKRKKTYQVQVKVEEDALHVRANDGTFYLQVQKPVCAKCNTPNWKFDFSGRPNAARTSMGDHFSINTSLGTIRYLSADGKTYCGGCIMQATEDYLAQFEFGRREDATMEIIRRIERTGVIDFEILEVSCWRKKKWIAELERKFVRDEREFHRYLGSAELTFDGNFTNNLFPAEFINFQYFKQ